MATSSAPLRIGGNAVWSEWFTGQIDDVRVYNRALTVAEVQTDMNTPVRRHAAPAACPPPPAAAGRHRGTDVAGSLAASGAQNQITLSWTASTDNVGVTGYSRYQNGVLGSSAAGTSYTFTGLACATDLHTRCRLL